MIGQRYINKIYEHHHTLIKTTNKQKKEESDAFLLLSGGGWTRTNDLQVMSPTKALEKMRLRSNSMRSLEAMLYRQGEFMVIPNAFFC